jgi:hypothetical protein
LSCFSQTLGGVEIGVLRKNCYFHMAHRDRFYQS